MVDQSKRRVSELDKIIGSKIRAERIAAGLSQENLASKVGVSYGQLQKYEKGENRIPASRLPDFAHAFNKPVGYFYDEAEVSGDVMQNSMNLNITREFAKVKKPELRVAVSQLVRELANL